ncbi:helix-turn-helix domain-containing protein [Vibrio gangliei]|uniref:helix-turn-helix domain-containing protein n=1 Tax=Vibrio gangliei TaxID=2077090 RepID=UPI000D020CC1|nr:helix-turn-helix domain-containing protein [Vibrio gangliei]
MPKKKYTKYDKETLQAIYDTHGSIANVSRALGVTYPTAHAWMRKFGVKTKKLVIGNRVYLLLDCSVVMHASTSN